MTQYSGSQYANTKKQIFCNFSRSMCVAICCLLPFAGTVYAQQQTIADAVTQCSNESNSLERLVCYDRLAKSLRQFSGLDKPVSAALPPVTESRVSAPAVATSNAAVVQPRTASSAEDTFGLENMPDKKELVEKLSAAVTEVGKTARDRGVFTLDNGQVWHQTDSGTLRVREGDTIYIERGALGAFYLGKENVNRRIRVRRAK